MFENKKDVDRHVDYCLKKVQTENERNLRSFAFAKLYFNVGEYEMSRRYISNYLIAKPKSSEAHLWLGKIYEKAGRREAALEAYRTSLDIDPKQNGLILKVCELLASNDVSLETTRAKFWSEQGQLIAPQHPAVFNLRARLAAAEDGPGADDVRRLFLSELEQRPTDVGLRVRLLQHLLHHNQLTDAYNHVAEIEAKDLPIFQEHLAWYETVAAILVRYRNENSNNNKLNWEFWMLIVSALDKLVALFLDENIPKNKSLSECVKAVFNLDQTLTIAAENINNSCPEKQFAHEFLIHYRAQLCFHLATLLFQQAKKDQMKYVVAAKFAIPLLLSSYHSAPVELQCVWLEHSADNRRRKATYWHRAAAFRCSQAGHVLLGLARTRRSSFPDRASQLMTGQWREKILKQIFITRDQQVKLGSSYFLTCPQLEDVPVRLPDTSELLRYDEIAQLVHPDNLHYIVWIGLNNDPVNFRCSVFDGLQFSVRNIPLCSAESLCVLDIQAFIYCCIFCTQANIEESKHLILYNSEKPAVLPACITDPYGTLNQTKWYSSVYKMFKNETGSSFSDVRLTLIKGIEIVRCEGSHGLDPKLLVLLAQTFAKRAKKSTKQSEIEALESRADLYWRAVLPMLEKLRNNQTPPQPQKRWFEYHGKDMNLTEIVLYIEEGKLFSAQQLMKKKEHEKALKLLSTLKDPYASFYQARTYKLLADEQMSHNKESLTSEMRSQNIILLSKARDCLYLTLDRLREPSTDKNHPLNIELGTEIELIEHMLSRIDPDNCHNRNECDGMSDENISSVGSVGEPAGYSIMHNTYHNSTHLNSTPHNLTRREARPSPERLDAQLRQMAAAKDAAVAHILDQNRIFLEEIRGFKDAVTGLTTSVNELKDVKKSVDDLKGAVDDLQNMKEQLYEIKKDLTELKKDTNKLKSSQINEEDLYALEEEYGVDYNINSAGASGFNNLYPNFPQRLQNTAANTLAYGAPGLYPSLYPMYPYGGLPTLPFADGHVPDFRMQPTPLAANIFANKDATTPGNYNNLALNTIPAAPLLQPALPTTTATPAFQQQAKAPPVNVVITASDPLPTTSTTQPVLSVTIPPQHLKGNQPKPHNYQIPLPVTTQPAFTNVASAITTAPMPVSTQNLLSNVAPPVYSSLTVKSPNQSSGSSKGLGLQIEKSLAQSFTPNTTLDLNKSSEGSILEEHDPCPDFKPIIPLPDEVPVTTGEEGEHVLFCEHAKLYRFVDKEWRERGIGSMKLLHNKSTNKVRILMRRDQVHKICANHFLESDMQLTQMPKNERAYIWAANDFADENMVLEKFCVRFKTVEEAKKFAVAFENAKTLLSASTTEISKPVLKPTLPDTQEVKKLETSQPNANSLGGFVFTSTPTFKPKTDDKAAAPSTPVDTAKPSPFASFTFGTPKSTTTEFKPVQSLDTPSKDTSLVSPKPVGKQPNVSVSEEPEDEEFVPTTEFKPVIPLPDLVEVKTGEENYEVLYEVKAKLLRFDSTSKEWKERGVGFMKILKDKTVRLLMRREQVHKVCCNHQLLKTMVFTNMPKNNRVLNWCAQDFSENVVKTEMFAIRFRTAELCEEFLQMIHKAQAMLDQSNNVTATSSRGAGDSTPSLGWGDKFKPKDGSWECSTCYVYNSHGTECVACGSSRDGDASKDNSQSPQKFTKPSPAPVTPSPKPKVGTWQCKVCFIHNDGKHNYCEACDSPKNDNIPRKNSSVDLNASGPQFSFGSAATPTTGWGDLFKPKAGAWECKACYISNDASTLYCIACESPKDDTVPKKENKGLNLATDQKFSFGIPPTTEKTEVSTSIFGGKPQPSAGFTFGIPQTTSAATGFTFEAQKAPEPSATGFSFGTPTTASEPLNLAAPSKATFTFTLSKPAEKKEEFVFGSPNKHEFEFKPRSPRKVSGSGDGDDSDVAEEEECDTYFKPVIPLPDKIDVKTGEEDETVLYCHRAKLFRFTNGEWKERGIGDVKILKHPTANKLRVLMRREQVHKICLNHALTNQVEYKPKDDHTWLFSAADYSDGEIAYQQFCLRFKNAEIATQFMDAANKARNQTPKIESEADPDLEIVYELTVPLDLQEKALALQLPKNFYAYLQKEPCKGCIGCHDDDFVFSAPKPAVKTALGSVSSTSSLFGTPSTLSPNTTIFESPKSTVSSTFSFGSQSFSSPFTTTAKTTASNIFTTPKTESSIFGGGSMIFGQTTITPIKNDAPTLTSLLTQPSTPPQTTAVEQKSPLAPPKLSTIFGNSSSPLFMGGTPTTPTISQQTNKSGVVFGSSSSIFSGSAAKPDTNIFGGTPKTETSNIFGGISTKTETPTNIFGGFTTTTSQPVFGSNFSFIGAQTTPSFGSLANQNKTETTPSFGSLANKAETTAPTFGSLATKTETTAPTFGSIANKTETTVPSFGSLANKSETTAPSFGSLANKSETTAPSFGSLANKTETIAPSFGSIANKTETSALSFGSLANKTETTAPSFGSLANKTETTTPSFGSLANKTETTTPSFGALANKTETTKPSFGSLANKIETTTPSFGLLNKDEPVLKCDTGLSFAALASANSSATFAPAPEKETKPFSFAGAGSLVFGGKKTEIKVEKDKSVNEEEEETAEDDDNYDPHYEPIVPLPEAIVVKTGEEDETVMFSERAKLYRYSGETKEWKERGVGNMKLLFHPQRSTYRLLLRREQVHKLVLNQLITTEMDLQPLQTSDRAWCWYGYNHTEDGSQLEQLAVRFKNPELAKQFLEAVTTAQENVKTKPPTTEEEEPEEDEYGSDYSDENKTMFCKRCTLSYKTDEGGEWIVLGMGVIKMLYDSEMYGARVEVTDDSGAQLSNTIMALNTVMKMENTSCVWRSMEWSLAEPTPRVLRAQFSSAAAAQEMYYFYEEALQYAQHSEIVDTFPQ